MIRTLNNLAVLSVFFVLFLTSLATLNLAQAQPATSPDTKPTETPESNPTFDPEKEPTQEPTQAPTEAPDEEVLVIIDTDDMEDDPAFGVLLSALGQIVTESVAQASMPYCAVVKGLEQSLIEAMVNSYCPDYCEKEYSTKPIKKVICKKMCAKTIQCYYAHIITQPVPPIVTACFQYSDEDVENCLAHFERLEALRQ